MKSINWKLIGFIILAVPVVNFFAGQIGRLTAESLNTKEVFIEPKVSQESKIQLVVSSQDAEGIDQSRLDLTFLKSLEVYTAERVEIKAKEYLASIGQPDAPVLITSESTYVYAGSMKLAVIRLRDAVSRQVFIAGIVGNELKRVACIRRTDQDIPISYGPCAEKIYETFGVKVGG